MKQKINYLLGEYLGVEIIKTRPKESIEFTRDYFKNQEVEVCEIGVFRGENAREIHKNLNVKKFFLIDPYLEYKDYENDGSYKIVKEAKIIAHKRLKKWENKNFWINQFSDKAIYKIKNNSLDFIYIDGNHSYNYVLSDLRNYWDKLKIGGILAGHDIQYKEVSEALIDFIKDKDLKVQFGDRRDWWIIKNGK